MKETKHMYDSNKIQSKIFGLSSSLSKDLSELNKQITISNAQLIQCTKNQDKLNSIIQALSSQGISSILTKEYQQSLIYLGEAQRILQYVASCGKVIDRSLIITVLHNIACAYEKLYDLPKLSSYLQALIYNLSISLENSEANNPDFISNQKAFIKGTHQFNCLCAYLQKKMNYGQYHLQFSALTSKNFDHDRAIAYSKQAITIFKQICQVCEKYESYIRQNQQQKHKVSTLLNLSRVPVQLNPSYYETYVKKIRKLMMRGYPNKDQSQSIHNIFAKFTIGKVIQMNPKTISECNNITGLNQQCSKIEKVRKALYISAGYFTIGTEYRLLSSASQSKNQNCKSSDEFMFSELYHLYCIFTVLVYVPCQTLFLQNLLTSYNNHYEGQLEKSIKNRPTNFHENEENNKQFQLQILPQHSSIQEGESKWSRSQLKSFSEENNQQIFIRKNSKQKNKFLIVKNKTKVGIQYKVNLNGVKSVNSLGKASSIQKSTESFKDGYKHKTERSIKKSSLQKSLRSKTKSSEMKKKETRLRKKTDEKYKKNQSNKLLNSKKDLKGIYCFKQEYLSPSNKNKSKNKSGEASIKNKSQKGVKSLSKQARDNLKKESKLMDQKLTQKIQKKKRSKSRKSQKKKSKKSQPKTVL